MVFRIGISAWHERAQSSQRPFRYQFSHRYAHVSRISCLTQNWYISFTAHSLIPSGLGCEYPGISGWAQRWASIMSTMGCRCSSGQNTCLLLLLTSSVTSSSFSGSDTSTFTFDSAESFVLPLVLLLAVWRRRWWIGSGTQNYTKNRQDTPPSRDFIWLSFKGRGGPAL